MKKIVFGLILILLISGCTGLPNVFGLFEEGPEVKELPPDVIVVQNINVIPPPPINSDDQFSVSFEISNQEEIKEIEKVSYALLDDGLCNTTPERPSDSFENFVPGEIEFVEWTFDSPSSKDIGGLSTTCPVRFKVNYSFEAVSEIEVNVVSEDRYNQLQRSGEFTAFTPTLTMGRGPIKIYIDFGATLPIRASTSENKRILPVYITVEDKGTGLLPQIPDWDTSRRISPNLNKELIIKVPEDFDLKSNDCGRRFRCNVDQCWSIQNITMINRKSPTIRCSFTVPEDVSFEKTYFINAFLNYTYDLINEVEVGIKPLA